MSLHRMCLQLTCVCQLFDPCGINNCLQQTQSELRAAQVNLAQSEYGKEKRLKILRRTHQSALSLKQSLIQELQDIVAEKDEYINELEDRLTGKQSDIRKPKVIIVHT